MFRYLTTLVAAVICGSLVTQAALAQDAYPTRPIKLVVPYGAGGPTDITGRVVAEYLSQKLGQPVVVENKPGASTMLGGENVLSQPADGHTILLNTSGMYETLTLFKSTPYKPENWQPLSLLRLNPWFVSVHSSLPVNNIAELKAYAEKQAGPLNAAVVGSATGITGVNTRLLEKTLGLELNKIAYKSTADIVSDIRTAKVQVGIGTSSMYNDLRLDGTLKFIGAFTAEPVAGFDNVPTLASQGMPYEAESWTGLFVKAGTPKHIVDLLVEATQEAVASERFQKLMALDGSVAQSSTPEGLFEVAYTKNYMRWLDMLKALDLKIEPQ